MNKTGEISNNFLALLVVVAIVVVLAGFMMPAKMTGNVASEGTLAADLTSASAINFTDASIDFGATAVPEGMTNCTVNSESSTTCTGSAPATGFVVENIGNEDLALQLATTKNAADLIGGTSPTYKWKVEDVEGGSCTGAGGSYVAVNKTAPGTEICSVFKKTLATNTIKINVELKIPSDAVSGAKSDTFTATGTA